MVPSELTQNRKLTKVLSLCVRVDWRARENKAYSTFLKGQGLEPHPHIVYSIIQDIR